MNNEVFFIADLHIPYEDKAKVNRTLDDISRETPDIVVLGGDILDFYTISRFRKDPDRASQLQKELNKYYNFMTRLRKVHSGQLIYLVGNHEERLEKYLMENPELHGLDVLQLPNLLKADKYNMNVTDEWTYKDVLFKHGDRVTKYNAAAELIRENMSGISGHKHNYNVASNTTRTSNATWISAPCLCDIIKADYVKNPNWQQGYVVMRFNKRKTIGHEVRFL